MPHSAVLLAGGKSSRMGRDKALIEFQGRPLWRHQLEVLRATLPVELFVSAAADAPYQGECRIIPDPQPGLGPLSGITAALGAITSEWLLVLAVDVPRVGSEFLSSLVAHAVETGRGVVPGHENGDIEPLVAVYPKTALAFAETLMREGELRARALIARLAAAGLMATSPVSAEIAARLANWNTPADVAANPGN